MGLRFTSQNLHEISDRYHQLLVPTIVENKLRAIEPDSAQLIAEAPDFIRWNEGHDTFLTINPTYTKAKTIVEAINEGSAISLKDSPEGISLLAWFAHPRFLQFISSGKQVGSERKRMVDLEADGSSYLVTILDLKQTHLRYLEELKALALDHLANKFGVDPNKDRVRLYFHFPYDIETATLHLHVRVNTPVHKLDVARSFDLDEVISYLRSGKSIEQLILDRQARNGGLFYSSAVSLRTQEMVLGKIVEEIPNSFLNDGP